MTDNFYFKDLDKEGLETLSVISEAKRFNQWTFDTIRRYCKGNILEIGSGIGNISDWFIQNGYEITLSDIRENYRTGLKKKYQSSDNVKGVLDIDIAVHDISSSYPDLINKFDSIFSMNVIEHIEDDNLALKNCSEMLKPGGNLIILVPAYQSLYNRFDKELMHYRRYNAKTLSGLLTRAGLEVSRTFYFNAAGIPGWYVSGKIQKNKTIPKKQMQLYNSLVPVFKLMDRILMRSIGLSVICIARKR